MLWIIVNVKALTCLFTASFCFAQSTRNFSDITSLNKHVKKMDAVLLEVKSHSRAQEEQFRAILTGIVSQLTQSTYVTKELQLKVENLEEELGNLTETSNKTLIDYNAALDELSELKLSHSNTVLELTELKQSHNETVLELKELKRSYNETVLELEELKGQYQDIGFEATLDKPKTYSKSERIIFDKVTYNTGNGYSPITGFFTVPESGLYLIWTNIVYKHVHSDIAFSITTATAILGNAYGYSDEPRGTASATTITYLKKGEHVWLYPSIDVRLDTSYPSAGAVLIKTL